MLLVPDRLDHGLMGHGEKRTELVLKELQRAKYSAAGKVFAPNLATGRVHLYEYGAADAPGKGEFDVASGEFAANHSSGISQTPRKARFPKFRSSFCTATKPTMTPVLIVPNPKVCFPF
jgi:hypothetical protein